MRIAGGTIPHWTPRPGARLLSTALLVLAFLFQNYIAERHFHAIDTTTSHASIALIGSDALTKPFVPTSDQRDDDCPLCQVLGLGATLDVAHAIALADPSVSIQSPDAVRHDVVFPATFFSSHRPRGPPAPFSHA